MQAVIVIVIAASGDKSCFEHFAFGRCWHYRKSLEARYVPNLVEYAAKWNLQLAMAIGEQVVASQEPSKLQYC